jgi:acetyltransferase-like isoleucine patch superfamily enzyme
MITGIFLKIYSRIRTRIYELIAFFTTFFLIMICKLQGIKIGRHSKFYGYATLLRKHQSIITIGSNCRFRSKAASNLIGINHRCIIATHSPIAIISIGDNCGFSGTVIGAFLEIRLGKNVRCGSNTLITDSDWHPDDPRVGFAKPIIIGDNVWLGYGSIVMKGVTIGENTVIGAGSIVTKDIPANVIAAGNPCKVIKTITK